ncbi:MAG: PEGA domain-containing protein [Terriglobales bacterium]
MQRLLAPSLVFLLILSTPAQQVPPASVSPSTPAAGFVLEDGTPVRLRLSRNVSSADAHVGDTVDFEVLEEVKVGNIIVIPKGGVAWGTVTQAERKKRLARGGKLDMTVDAVRLLDGQKAALRAVKTGEGGGHTGAMTAGIVATGLLFWPAAPFFLFMHGKDITVPKGAEITAYINGNVSLEQAKFVPPTAAPIAEVAKGAPEKQSSLPTTLEITSTPPGADIELDGSFVGNTPSSVGVSEGEHTVKLSKSGYTLWERKIKTTTGSVRIAPELQPIAAEPSK